jgi:hypothetical protein
MKRANTMSTITVELTIKVKTKFIPSNAEKTNGFISPQMSNFHKRRRKPCRQLPKAFALQELVDISLDKNIAVHLFPPASRTSQLETSAWLYNLPHD